MVYNPFANSTEDALKECREKPAKCLSHLALDAAVIVAAYGFLVWAVDGARLSPTKALKFYALFMVVAFVLRYLDVDFQDQLTRVAGFQIGTKLFMAMAGA
jgi:hypothetical protein